ncbi:MAG TPA: hypothetical protein VM491_19825, partial [Burkholderiaceae bacterium]|nr:hypothetical protein [Burkholderiaceae bacterium]
MIRELSRGEILRLAITAAIAFVVLWQRLLAPALLGLLVYAWSCVLADRMYRNVRPGFPVAPISGMLVGLLVVAAFVLLIMWTARLVTAGEVHTFLLRIEDSLHVLRRALPEPLAEVLPASLEDLRVRVVAWVKQYAVNIGAFGGTVAH